jgi:RNA polymerase sigma factor (sigma-70 family)
MVMNWDRIEPWDYIVDYVSIEYHRKFTMVEVSDIKQSLYEWFATHPNKLDEWEAIGKRDAKNLIYRSLRNQALDYCQRWKAKSLGYDTSDLHYYDPEVIEILLSPALRGEVGVQHKLNLGMPGRPPAPAEGGNLQVLMLEIEGAYWKLSKEERRILFLRHIESMDYKEIANHLNFSSEDAARMRVNRAIKRIVYHLGGFRPFLDKDTQSIPQDEISDIEDREESNKEQDDNDSGGSDYEESE